MKTLDLTRLSLRNMSLTEIPTSLSKLVGFVLIHPFLYQGQLKQNSFSWPEKTKWCVKKIAILAIHD